MAETKIEWANYTMNPWLGCTKVSSGCDNCYAEAMMDHRFGKVQWGPHGERKRTSEVTWRKPLQWARAARAIGKRPRVFCASLADVFDNQVPNEWRSKLWDLIAATPELDWLLLTKRPENILNMISEPMLPNIWLGTTAEDQKHFDHRYIKLSNIPAVVHFISYEPALGPLSIRESYPFPDWIICGGESGPNRRQMDERWARNLRDECAERSIPFFMKQMTGKTPIPEDLMVREFPRTL